MWRPATQELLLALWLCSCSTATGEHCAASSATDNGDTPTGFDCRGVIGDSADSDEASCCRDAGERRPEQSALTDLVVGDGSTTEAKEILDATVDRSGGTSDEYQAVDSMDVGGRFLSACDDEAPCVSGPCVPYDYPATVSYCTVFCTADVDCGFGFACPPPAGFGNDLGCDDPEVVCVCLPSTVFICKPCDDSGECSSPASPETVGVCLLEPGESVGHCAAKCEDTPACPPGYVCNHIAVESGVEDLCVPVDGHCAEP